MKPYYSSPEGVIYHGHVLDVLRSMSDESVQCCVTSPPYWGLRDYGLPPTIWDSVEGCGHVWGDERYISNTAPRDHNGAYAFADSRGTESQRKATTLTASQGQFCQLCGAWSGCLGLEPTPELFIQHMVQVFREVHRVLRNDAVLFLNLGDSYWGGKGQSGQGSPEYQAERQDVSLNKPHHQIAGQKLTRPSDGKHQTYKPKDLCGIPWRVALALQADGWWLRSDIIWHKPNPMPESVTDRPTKAHEYIFLLTKSPKYFYDADAIREKQCDSSFERSRYDRKADKTNKGLPTGKDRTDDGKMFASGLNALPYTLNPSGRNKRTVWTVATQPMPQAHFATFPEKLIEPCILAGTSAKGCCVECGASWERVVESNQVELQKTNNPGKQDKVTNWDREQWPRTRKESKTIGWQAGCKCDAGTKPCVVLDIFGGAMTSAIVAHKHGRKFVMIELSKTYIDEIGIPRIEQETRQLKLF